MHHFIRRRTAVAAVALLLACAASAVAQVGRPMEVPTDRWYRIINVNSGMALDVAGESREDYAEIIQSDVAESASQHWRFVETNAGYMIENRRAVNKFIDVLGADKAEGTKLVIFPKPNGAIVPNQVWTLIKGRRGTVALLTNLNRFAMTVSEGSRIKGARAIQWPARNTPDQFWKLEPVTPE